MTFFSERDSCVLFGRKVCRSECSPRHERLIDKSFRATLLNHSSRVGHFHAQPVVKMMIHPFPYREDLVSLARRNLLSIHIFSIPRQILRKRDLLSRHILCRIFEPPIESVVENAIEIKSLFPGNFSRTSQKGESHLYMLLIPSTFLTLAVVPIHIMVWILAASQLPLFLGVQSAITGYHTCSTISSKAFLSLSFQPL